MPPSQGDPCILCEHVALLEGEELKACVFGNIQGVKGGERYDVTFNCEDGTLRPASWIVLCQDCFAKHKEDPFKAAKLYARWQEGKQAKFS